MNKTLLLSCQGLTKIYQEGKLETPVLRGVDLTLAAGEMLAVVGSSGSGKSTLLHLLGALDTPTEGSVNFSGQNIHAWSNRQQAEFRNRELGFVYQFHHLLGEFSALENAAMPLLIAGLPVKQASAKAAAMLERVGLGHRLDHKSADSIYSLMCELNAMLGTAFVVVTHDRALAAKLHRRISLVDGLVAGAD